MKNSIKVYRYIPPVTSILVVLCLFTILPTFYIAVSDFHTAYWVPLSYSEYRYAAYLSLAVSFSFFSFFLLGVVLGRKNRLKFHVRSINVSEIPRGSVIIPCYWNRDVFHLLRRHQIVRYVGLLSSVVLLLVFVTGGYEKISLFGADIERLEYRLYGDDRERVLTVLIQVFRRLILPFCIIYLYVLRLYTGAPSYWILLFLSIGLFAGIVTTLERSPLMLAIVMFFYIFYVSVRSRLKLLLYAFIFVIFIMLLGGVLTFVQYNVQDFNYIDVVVTGINFLFNRAIMAPNFVPIELAYGVFDLNSQNLLLRYSRLAALFGGDYIVAGDSDAIFVGPVGAIADIWRNLGALGIIFLGFFLGILASVFDSRVKRLDPPALVATSFTAISLVFYLWYGTFFSQGVLLQILFMLAIVRLFKADSRRIVITSI